jgi:uncharacterized Tic20 family protein
MPDPSDESQPPPPPPPPAPPPPPPPAAAAPPVNTGVDRLPFGAGLLPASTDKLHCILSHLVPGIIWLWKKDESPAVNTTGKEALNFHLTALIGLTGLSILSSIPIIGCLAFPVLLLALAVSVIQCVVGALKASDGYSYKYPVNLRLIP